MAMRQLKPSFFHSGFLSRCYCPFSFAARIFCINAGFTLPPDFFMTWEPMEKFRIRSGGSHNASLATWRTAGKKWA